MRTFFFAALVIMAGCSPRASTEARDTQGIDKVELYFRDFFVLSYLPYGESELMKYADVSVVLTEPAAIALIFDPLSPSGCSADSFSVPQDPNLYLLARFYKDEKLVRVDYATQHFYWTAGQSACRITRVGIEEIRSSVADVTATGQ